MQDLLRPRRLATALAIFLSLSTIGVATAGFESVEGAEGGPLPSSFALPPERVRDAAQYSRALVRVDPTTGVATVLDERPYIGWEWMTEAVSRSYDGAAHHVNRLHQWGWQPETQDAPQGPWVMYAQPVYSLAKADGRIVSYAYLHDEDLALTGDRAEHYDGPDAVRILPCGPKNLFAGKAVPLDGPVRLYGPCAWPNFWSPEETFQAIASQRVGEVDTVLFSNPSRLGSSEQHVWLSPAIPFPVRIASQDQDDNALWHVYTMASYRAGEGPAVVWGAGAPSLPASPLAWAPRSPNGPDEAGLVHPFPISSAIDAARSDPAGAAFTARLDTGYLAFASFSEQRGDQRSFTWNLMARDADGVTAIHVTQATASTAPADPAGLGADLWPDATTLEVVPSDDAWSHLAPPSAAPTSMPTAASLLENWRAFAGPDYTLETPLAYGFAVTCFDPACKPEQVRTTYDAGIHHQGSTTDRRLVRDGEVHMEPATGHRMVHSILQVDLDGMRGPSASLWEFHHEDGTQAGPVLQLPRSGAAPVDDGADVRTFQSLAWVAPAAPWVAGSGALAAVVALAYLVWPAIKSGAFLGLFSRVTEPSALLEHPQRRRLADLVAAQPGIHLREAGRRLGMGRTQVAHHVAKLEAAGILRATRSGGYVVLHLRGTSAAAARAAGTTKADGARAVLLAIAVHPGAGPREVARATGMSPGTVSYHLRRLRAAGLVGPEAALGLTALGTQQASAQPEAAKA